MDKTIKAGVTGVIGAAASFIMGESENMTVGGMDVPVPVVIGISTGVSSIAADYANDMWYPDMARNERLSNLTSAAVGLGVSGASTSLLLNRGIGDNNVNAFVLGAASYAAGDWVTNRFVNPPEVIHY